MDSDFTAMYRYLGGVSEVRLEQKLKLMGLDGDAKAPCVDCEEELGGEALEEITGCTWKRTYKNQWHQPFWIYFRKGA